MKDLDSIEKNVKKLDENINNTVVEILKDTIKDCTKHNTKLFMVCMAELAVIIITIVVSLVLLFKMNERYDNFLKEFDYEGTETIYQDLDTGDNGDIVNPKIEANK